jgi:hypothetical protein
MTTFVCGTRPPPASLPPQDALLTNAASPGPLAQAPLNKLEAEAAAEVQHGQIEHARPLDWDSRSRQSTTNLKKGGVKDEKKYFFISLIFYEKNISI